MKITLFMFLSVLILTFSATIFAQNGRETVAKAVGAPEIVVSIEGGRSIRMNAADLAKLPRKDVRAKDHDGVEATYSGYELRELLAPAGAKFGKDLTGPSIAQFLVVEAADGYRAVYSLTELDPDFSDKVVILADNRDGKPLDAKNGPWQVIATGEKKHARWVRQVTALKVLIAK